MDQVLKIYKSNLVMLAESSSYGCVHFLLHKMTTALASRIYEVTKIRILNLLEKMKLWWQLNQPLKNILNKHHRALTLHHKQATNQGGKSKIIKSYTLANNSMYSWRNLIVLPEITYAFFELLISRSIAKEINIETSGLIIAFIYS